MALWFQWVELLPANLPYEQQFESWLLHFLIVLGDDVLMKAVVDSPGTWASVLNIGSPDEAPGSWILLAQLLLLWPFGESISRSTISLTSPVISLYLSYSLLCTCLLNKENKSFNTIIVFQEQLYEVCYFHCWILHPFF